MREAADDALLTFLRKHGCIDAAAADAAQEYARANRVPVLEALCDGGFVDEETIADLFERTLRLNRVSLGQPIALPKPLDQETLKLHLAMPAAIASGRLVLAMANPLDHEALRKVGFASGLRAVPAVATLTEVRAALARSAQAEVSAERESVFAEASAERAALVIDTRVVEQARNSSPIVKMATLLLEQAITLRASDVHLEPTAEGLTVRYRIDGNLEEATRLSHAVRNPLIARLKVMAALDIAERRVPQDGGVALSVDGRMIDCRVSTLPTQYGEKVVIRILDAKSALVRLDQLGFEPAELARVEECLRQPHGLILTTGPTGSGKSTTLYAMLQALHSAELNIVTVENPIEYRLPGINQTEVHERQGMTFAAALRSILRQDPDVILVGEIRDRETAEIAIQAAQTGHLVLSTLHTNDAVGAITRLAKLGVDGELIASSLLLVIAQRLVRAVCPRCAEPLPSDAAVQVPWHKELDGAALRRGRGCTDCRNTGYRGRLGIFEILRTTLDAKRLIADGAGEVELRELARRQGGRTLMQVALDKVRSGRTTLTEIIDAVRSDEGSVGCPSCGAPMAEHLHGCPHCSAVLGQAVASVGEEPAPADAPATSMELIAPKSLAAGSILGAGVRGLCAAGGLDDVGAAELELAVVEACNLACAASTDNVLHIAVELSPDGYTVCVSDEGPAWAWPRPNARPPDVAAFADTAAPEVRAFLIRSSVDDASYERAQQTNRLWLVKRPSARDDAADLSHSFESSAMPQ